MWRPFYRITFVVTTMSFGTAIHSAIRVLDDRSTGDRYQPPWNNPAVS
jgi:hypothetical protein